MTEPEQFAAGGIRVTPLDEQGMPISSGVWREVVHGAMFYQPDGPTDIAQLRAVLPPRFGPRRSYTVTVRLSPTPEHAMRIARCFAVPVTALDTRRMRHGARSPLAAAYWQALYSKGSKA